MAIKDADELHGGKPFLDLTGPQGNAYVITGTARDIARQLGWEKEKIDSIIADMESDNYEHLVKIFDENFGEYIDIYR